MVATTEATVDRDILEVSGPPIGERPPQRLIDALILGVASSDESGQLDVEAPYTADLLARVPISSDADIAAAFGRARREQVTWAAMPLRARAAILLRFHDLILKHRDEGLDLLQWETGKSRRDALEELLDVAVTTRHYARDAARLLRTRRHRGALPLVVGIREYRHPKGVVGVVAPWNYPLTLAASDAVPALMAGNAVVLKPDSQTPLTALWVASLLHEAGMPEGVLQIIVGPGSRLGSQMVDNSDYIMFTGSTRIGRAIAGQCGQRLIGCSLELGGKNALIVAHDADLDRAADVAVRASFANSGQLCVSMERLYVHESVREAFLDRFLPRVKAMRLQAHVGWGADMGSLISATQLQRVAEHVDDAVAKGATVLAGGRARPDIGPYFYEPTVLSNMTEQMAACTDETFGPVLAVYPFADEEEAIAHANATSYGLNAAIITRDTRRGRRIAERLRAGTVNINEGYAATWGSTRATMGGMGDSGLGRRHGDEGLLKYTESQTVATQRVLGFGAPFGLSDKQWGDTLTTAVSMMKKAGLK